MLGLFGGLFHKLLDRIDAGIATGAIEVALPDGTRRMLGGRNPGPTASVEIRYWRALLRLAKDGSSGWYLAWANGEWASADPVAVIEVFGRNGRSLGDTGRPTGWSRAVRRLGHWWRRNSRIGSRRNIAYHYDLGNDFYCQWLDPSMTYSSAIFADPEAETLEQAQRTKLASILARTGAKPGDTILEIGCGWGSFAETAACAGVRLHGITLSKEQKRFVEERMARQGLGGVTVSLTDYRDVEGRFDAVASIEMVEAVGRAYWRDYLAAIARALKPGGRAAVQYISMDAAIFEGYAANVDFIQTFIFPGGLLICEPEFRAIAESLGLRWEDRRGFGASYAETLRRWRANFDAAVAERRLPAEFDEAFVKLWRFYLIYCEGGFRGGGIDVAQVTLVREG